MDTKFCLKSIKFSDDTTITFERNDIVVFVGPNNSGKSASLKEINSKLRKKANVGNVIKDLEFEKSGAENDLYSFLDSFSHVSTDQSARTWYKGLGFNLNKTDLPHYWRQAISTGLDVIQPVFVNLLSTESRLTAANPPNNISLTTEPPQHPIHFLQRDDAMELKFSEYFKKAFGLDLMVHRNAGNNVPLHIGIKPSLVGNEDRVSLSYIKKLEALPKLNEQGDGMRGFVGVLLNAFVANHSILLIDEPEAFLHPPQARLLGKMLGQDLPTDRQLFLATHSIDFLKGILDSNNQNLKVIRIERDGNINHVNVLDKNEINTIWNDSLLRHSNILDGLFHSQVIVCESDSDCRFYSAVLDALYDGTDEISPDSLFIHCGGKHRIPTVINSLKKLNVKVSVIADFDVLNSVNPLKDIYESKGGIWSEIEADYRTVKNSIDIQRPELETADVKREISYVLDTITERIFPIKSATDINRLLKKISAWSKAKEIGKAYIPNGEQTAAYNRLSIRLKDKNIYAVEIGELESFVKSIGNHGPSWVSEVLKKDLKNDEELEDARVFIKILLQ